MILGNDGNEIAPIVQQLQDTTEWQVNAITDKEEAVNLFQSQVQDVIIFSDTFDHAIKNGLEKLFRFQSEDVIVLTTVKETTIWEEVNDALHKLSDSKRPGYSFVDDALKNAKFNITFN